MPCNLRYHLSTLISQTYNKYILINTNDTNNINTNYINEYTNCVINGRMCNFQTAASYLPQ